MNNLFFNKSNGFKFDMPDNDAVDFHDDLIGAISALLNIADKANLDPNTRIDAFTNVADVVCSAKALLDRLCKTNNNLDAFMDDYNASCRDKDGTFCGASLHTFNDIARKHNLLT